MLRNSQTAPMIYDVTFLDSSGEALFDENAHKITIPLRDDTPRDMQWMEYANAVGSDPLAYKVRLMRPDEARKVVRHEKITKAMESATGQFLKLIGIGNVEDLMAMDRLRRGQLS